MFLADFGEDLPRNGGPATVRLIWDEPGTVSFRVMYGQADDDLAAITEPRATAVAGALAVGDTVVRGRMTFSSDLAAAYAAEGETVTVAGAGVSAFWNTGYGDALGVAGSDVALRCIASDVAHAERSGLSRRSSRTG